jgi:hypothetical protein
MFDFIPATFPYPVSKNLQPFELFGNRVYTPLESALIIDAIAPGPFTNGYITGFGYTVSGTVAGVFDYINMSFACLINGNVPAGFMAGFGSLQAGSINEPTSIPPIQIRATDIIQITLTNSDAVNSVRAKARVVGFFDLSGG